MVQEQNQIDRKTTYTVDSESDGEDAESIPR